MKPGQSGKMVLAQVEARRKEKLCVELRMAGYEFAAIADQAGYASAGAAYVAWKRAYDRYPRQAVEEARAQESARLNKLQRAIWSRAIEQKSLKDILVILKLMQRRAAMEGLDIAKQLTMDDMMTSIKDVLAEAEQRESNYTAAAPPADLDLLDPP